MDAERLEQNEAWRAFLEWEERRAAGDNVFDVKGFVIADLLAKARALVAEGFTVPEVLEILRQGFEEAGNDGR